MLNIYNVLQIPVQLALIGHLGWQAISLCPGKLLKIILWIKANL